MTAGAEILHDMSTSGGHPYDLLPTQIDRLRDHFTNSFYDFASIVCGMTKLHPPLHRPICHLFEQWGTPGSRRLMVQIPRGSYKTSLITISGPLWLLTQDPNRTIAIFNEKLDNSRMFVGAIEGIVRRSPFFHVLYSHLLPPGITAGDTRSTPKSWPFNSERLLFVRDNFREPEMSITAFGMGAASAGHHWSHTIMDDLISRAAADSPIEMQHAKNWFDTSMYLGVTPELWNCFLVCTRWHYDDVYSFAEKKHGFQLYRRSALENGKSIFPELWTTEHLLREQERDIYNFSAQLQNQPTAGRSVSFQPSWLRFGTIAQRDGEDSFLIDKESYSRTASQLYASDFDLDPDDLDDPPPTIPLHTMTKTLLVDPSPTTDTDRRAEPNARTALVMVGKDPWGRQFILELWAGNEEPIPLCRRILGMLKQWGTTRLGIEEVVFSKVYAPMVRYVAEREFRNMPISYLPLKPGRRDKDTRIAGLAPLYQAGMVYLNHGTRALHAEEYLTYPYGSTRDILDAESYSLDPGVLPRPTSGFESSWSEQEQWEEEDTRDAITGY